MMRKTRPTTKANPPGQKKVLQPKVLGHLLSAWTRKTSKTVTNIDVKNYFCRFPWMCSLKEAGFSGRHKCGVTLLSGHFSIFISSILIRHFLLSGPESREVVLVSAAHCNFVCKVLWHYLVIWWLKGLALKTCFDSTQRNNVTEGLDMYLSW